MKKIIKDKWQYHKWFAWYPIVITDYNTMKDEIIWLGWVERKINAGFYNLGMDRDWKYRIPKNQNKL